MTIANAGMWAAWDGAEGDAWTENADRYDAAARRIGERFRAAVPIGRTDRVLDVGCGTGRSTRDAARRAPLGSVLGVDLSGRMLAEARRRSRHEGLTNVEFRQADAQVHPFAPASFDLVISVFGAMFFADPVAALTNIGRALRAGGRIALLTWQRFERNPWLTEIFHAVAAGRDLPAPAAGVPGPFGLADPDAVALILRRAGLADGVLTPVTEPVRLGADTDDAVAFVAGTGFVRGLTAGLDHDARSRALGDLRDALARHRTADGILLGSAAWLVTARMPGRG